MNNKINRRKMLEKTGFTIAGAGTIMAAMKSEKAGAQESAQNNAMMGEGGGAPDAAAFGQSLTGLGISLLVTDVNATIEFSRKVLGADMMYSDDTFAIMMHGENLWMLHADSTYHSNPMQGLVLNQDGRGRGVELRLYERDPDDAEKAARDSGYEVLFETKNKPHGLRECYLLDPDGYCWVPSRHLKDGEG